MRDEAAIVTEDEAAELPWNGAPCFDMPRQAWLALFRDLAEGDGAAFDTLYRAAARRLFGLALWRLGSREDASDVVQEVFVRVAERRDRLARVDDPRSWLLAVTHRLAVDFVRRRRVRATEPLDAVPFVAARSDDVAGRIDAERVSALVAELPARQRDVIYLRHFAECSFAAIGDITGVSTFTAASRYRLGIGKLRRRLEERS